MVNPERTFLEKIFLLHEEFQKPPDKIKFIPPDTIIQKWEADYNEMKDSMIYDNPLPFDELITRLIKLQKRINTIQR